MHEPTHPGVPSIPVGTIPASMRAGVIRAWASLPRGLTRAGAGAHERRFVLAPHVEVWRWPAVLMAEAYVMRSDGWLAGTEPDSRPHPDWWFWAIQVRTYGSMMEDIEAGHSGGDEAQGNRNAMARDLTLLAASFWESEPLRA